VNASEKSHAELDESETLDRGDPRALGHFHKEIRALLPDMCVVGGCCGTDEEHVGEIAKAVFAS
jgi:homocysteine S-methyltransferase